MKRPGGERAAFGSSSLRPAARYPVTTSPERRPREQCTGKPPRKGLEHSEFKATRRHRRARRCTRHGLPSTAPAQRWRVQRATSAQHSSAKRPSADRAPSRGPSASIIKDREAAQAKRSRAKGPHGRSAGHRYVRTRRVERDARTVPVCKG